MNKHPKNVLLATATGLMAFRLAFAQTAPSAPSNSWLFDDGTGTIATANSGSANGALGANVAFSSTTFNGSGNSLDFSGTQGSNNNFNSGDIVDFAGLNNAFNGNSELSASFWIKASGTGIDQAWFSMSAGDGGVSEASINDEQDRFDLRYDSSVFQGSNSNTIAASFGSDTEVKPDDSIFYGQSGLQTTDWQHVGFTFNGANAVGDRYKLYIDGVQDTSPDSISTMNNNPTAEGVGTVVANQLAFLVGDGTKGPWKGLIDETAVWEEELTASEISWLSDSSNSLAAIPETSAYAALFGAGAFGLVLLRRRR